jgi:hypothetical protein
MAGDECPAALPTPSRDDIALIAATTPRYGRVTTNSPQRIVIYFPFLPEVWREVP